MISNQYLTPTQFFSITNQSTILMINCIFFALFSNNAKKYNVLLYI